MVLTDHTGEMTVAPKSVQPGIEEETAAAAPAVVERVALEARLQYYV
jgi:hypothetical protein